MDDRELIQRYAQAQDHQAFAELVRRHGDWVYSSARRQVGDPHLAEDVVQAVFLLLSRRARTLGSYAYLSGWLFKTLRYCAQAAIRQRRRRQHHERQAATMTSTQPPAQPDWSELSPILDQAIARLKTADREAVLLRFYERRTLDQVGHALGITEEAARKRVDRAVDKLRQNLVAKGIEAQSLSLSALILAHAVEAGPAGLVERITAGIAHGMASGTAGGIAKGAGKMMAWAKVKVAAGLLTGLVFASSGAIVLTGQVASSAPQASQPATAATAPPAAGFAAQSTTKSVFTGGGSVEVIAITAPGAQAWWAPDGSASTWRPSREIPFSGFHQLQPGEKVYDVAVKWEMPSNAGRSWMFPGGLAIDVADGSRGVMIGEPEVYRVFVPAGDGTLRYSAGLGSGPWQTLASCGAEGGNGLPLHTGFGDITISKATPTRDGLSVTLTDSLRDETRDVARRLVVISKEGDSGKATLVDVGHHGKTTTHTYRLDLPPEQIVGLRFEFRPYEWVEFRDISLNPGIRTNVVATRSRWRSRE